MLAALLAACAPVIGSSGGGQDGLAHARLLAITDSRRSDTVYLDSLLASASPLLRRDAALAIGQLKLVARVPALRELLTDADTAVAANAAFAIGLLKDSASAVALAGVIELPSPVAVEAAWALGELGEPARESIVAGLIRRTSTVSPRDRVTSSDNSPVTTALLLAAAKLRPVPSERILPFLGNGAGTVVWAASYALARTRIPGAVRSLLTLFASSNALVRANVARAIAKSAAGDSLGGEAVAVLATLVADRDPLVRINAVRSLASYGAPHMATVFRLMRDPDANVRIAAMQSLPATPTGIADTTWVAAWSADSGQAYREGLLAASARLRYLHPGLAEWRGSTDWRKRAAVADAAAASRNARLVDSIVSLLLEDPDRRVRTRAFSAIAIAFDSVPSVAVRVRAGLADRESDVRAAVLDALAEGARASAEGVPRALDALDFASRDSSNLARVAALGYIAAAWRRDSVRFDDRVRARIAALPVSLDPDERLSVAGNPLFASWGIPAGTARPIDWYQKRVRSFALPARAGRPAVAAIVTERGTITVELFGDDAPLTVDNFVTLARSGYYREVRFHRVVPNFVAQAGDPTGTGSGGPGYAIRDELNRRRYRRGTLGMALSGPDTGGSQWFITHAPQPHLDGGYTVFGQVTGGWEAFDALVQGDRIIRIDIR